jgi:uncharacterized membrane protein
MVSLGTIGGGYSQSCAQSVNDPGQVVGGWSNSSTASGPMLYIPGTGMLDLWKLISNPPTGICEGNFALP